MKNLALVSLVAILGTPMVANACDELGELPVPGVYPSVADGLAFAATHYSALYGDGTNVSAQLRIVIRVGFGVLALPVYKACDQTWEEADQTPEPPDVGGGAFGGNGTSGTGGTGSPGPWGGSGGGGGGGWHCWGSGNDVICRPLRPN